MSMVNGATLVVGLVSDTAAQQELQVLQDMQALGARVLAIVDDASVLAAWHPDHLIELRSGLDEGARAPLYLPPLQLMALHRALTKGLTPDRPTHLSAVVTLDAG
jgi:glucosamine--fructose-6-phosphate aminotransferase (isomerizing)